MCPMHIIAICMLLSLSYVLIDGCHPGGSSGYRYSPRRLSPMLRGQYVPSVSEQTVGASGPFEGVIRRGSPAFYRKLVRNYNTNIIFVDNEHDGSDRVMTKRCKDRLDTLAILVANRWDGVRLRVTEAWDDEKVHGEFSLHYEGRAVDLTTSDKDWRKYGRLARMAVEAGFDWVHYESYRHVHASVRTDDSNAAKYGGCFPSESRVMSSYNRSIRMGEIVPGDRILAVDRSTGKLVYSDVIMLMDKQDTLYESFIEISTAHHKITLTPNHMLYTLRLGGTCEKNSFCTTSSGWPENAIATFAGDVVEGQVIFVSSAKNSSSVIPAQVKNIRKVVRRGVIAPLTKHGTVIVDETVASCYGVLKSEQLAHAAFLPARTLSFMQSNFTFEGMHWYARTLTFLAELYFPSYMRVA
ncbi:unnamed protein product [Clavelina lepadiformis]|uniref:Hedgehog protein n=1 Tax=Clavelina lepadiformis TaxID=159417 RepID=A0ABP0G167_CLALP